MLVSGVYVRTCFGVGGLRIGNSIAMTGQGYARQNLGESGSTLRARSPGNFGFLHTLLDK